MAASDYYQNVLGKTLAGMGSALTYNFFSTGPFDDQGAEVLQAG